MFLLIDNYDSFTYNLWHFLGQLGADVQVVRNDKITAKKALELEPEGIIISPGPCDPDKAGISLEVIETAPKNLPIFGVCLGHQSIGQAFEGKIVHAKKIMHGKTSEIFHNGEDVFDGFENPFTATRYHSLVIEKESLPDCFEITAWTKNENGDIDEIMGIKHKNYPISGVQFHPESILTSFGHELLNNFLKSNIK